MLQNADLSDVAFTKTYSLVSDEEQAMLDEKARTEEAYLHEYPAGSTPALTTHKHYCPLHLATSIQHVPSHPSDSGRGVFAGRNFKRLDLVDACPTFVLRKVHKTNVMNNFVFGFNDTHMNVALGHCSMYNHADMEEQHLVHCNTIFL